MIQLQGFCPEVLANFTYDLANAAGSLTAQRVLVVGQSYATNTWEFTTNFFQAFDVRLTNGPNTMTLQATDLAGNTTVTNLTITLDYSSRTNPPAIRLGWPQDGSRFSGGAFTWRGWVDDPSDHVTAQAVDASGATNFLTGRVGRGGDFWIEGVPLVSGTNLLTLVATDSVGHASATNIAVVRSGLTLTIASLSLAGEQASGAISDPGYTVWVNGVKGTNNGDGTWVATGLQLRLSDDSVQARAIPNTDNGGSGSGAANSAAGAAGNPGSSQATDAESEMDWTVAQTFVQEYHLTGDYVNIYDGSISRNRDDWQEGLGGAGHFLSYSTNDPCSPAVETWTWLPCWWPNLLGGHFTSSWSCTNLDSWDDAYPPWDAVDDVPFHFEDDDYEDSAGWVGQYDERNRITLLTAGKPGSTGTQLYAVTAFVPGLNPLTGLPNDMFILPEQISLGSLGCLNPNGYLEAKLAPRSLVDVTPTVSGTNADFWDLAIQASPVVLQSLDVVSNSAAQVGGTNNWAAVKTDSAAWVYLQATLSTPDTNAANFIQWSGGEAVPGNPFQRRVTKTNSVETTVTATLGSTNISINVWIIWSTIRLQFSGTTPLNAQGLWTNLNPDPDPVVRTNSDLTLFCPGYDLGVQSYYTNLWRYSGNVGFTAWAKMCAIASVTPSGLHGIVTNDWAFDQYGVWHEFKDRVQNTADNLYFDDWRRDGTDGPHPWRFTHTPDNDDKLYYIDAPLIEQNSDGSTNSYEVHQNYQTWVTWKGVPCSGTNNFWHVEAGWKNGQSPPIQPTSLGTNTISPLPTAPQY
jgi:hypothetical protein